MKEKKERKNKSIFWYVFGSIILTVAGFMLIPPLIEKYGNKLYKSSLKNEEIDFDNLGPEIVKKNTGGSLNAGRCRKNSSRRNKCYCR